MKKRVIAIITLMMFVLTNVLNVMPTVYADELDSVFYEYDGYTVKYSVLESWEDTKKISVSVQNTGKDKIENWMIYFEPNGEIVDIWDAEKAVTSQSVAYIRNSRYNAVINVGESSNFTYLIKNNESAPKSFYLCQSRNDLEDGYSISMNEIYSWEDINFQGEITISNEGAEPIESWELTIDTNFTIDQITDSWAAEVKELGEGKYLLKGTYNSIIQPHSNIGLGFLGVKNGTPEIFNYSMSVVTVDENMLSSIVSKEFENEPLRELEIYASANINENELNISWIPDKEISGVEYKIIERNDEKDSSCIASTNDLGYVYILENNFTNKYMFVEAYYNDSFIGKSNEIIVSNAEGVFSSELVDTDSDNISDYIEDIIGTDINKSDTDDDSLDDYFEFFIVETDPLKTDTDNNGVFDGDEDNDSDGLTNLEELNYSTNPVNEDTDNDKLSDYDELFVYKTNPISEDTDNDSINDYDEVMLGINPNDNSDSNKIIEQKIEKNSECLSGVNVNGLPYKVSMDITASGYVEGSIKADNSFMYSSTYSFDTIGIIPEFNYSGGDVEEVTINFEFEEDYIVENDININSLNVFKYFDKVNMFVPIKTYKDEENNILSCKSDSLGTYCIKDIDEWICNFKENDTYEEEQISLFSVDSDLVYMSCEDDEVLLSDIDSENSSKPVYVCFAIDITHCKMGGLSDIDNVKEHILNVSKRLLSKFENINILILLYNQENSQMYSFDDFDGINEFLSLVNLPSYDNKYNAYVETALDFISSRLSDYGYKIYYDNTDVKYLFVYNRSLISTFNEESADRIRIENQLKKEKQLHVSFVLPPINNAVNKTYLSYYANNYDGKMFGMNDDNIDNQVYNYIAQESKLVCKAFPVIPGTPGEDDEPIDDPDEPIIEKPSNQYIISSNFTTITLNAPLTKNSKVNSDDDELTDIEELIQDDEIVKWDSDGNIILPTLSEIIRYCGLYAGMKYLPDDILDNDEYDQYLKKEILPVRSNPKRPDTDGDTYTDSEEIFDLNTNPLKFNSLLSSSDIDRLTDNGFYGASACYEYNQNLGVELAVFIANNVFGSTHDYKLVYKESILEYIISLSDGIQDSNEKYDMNKVNYYHNIGTQIEALLSGIATHYSKQRYDMFESAIDAYALERVEIIKQYRYGYLSSNEFMRKQDALIEYTLNNDIVKKSLSDKKISSVIKGLDNANTVVTYISIATGGIIQFNSSLNDIFNIITYSDIITQDVEVLDEISNICDNPYLVIEDSHFLSQAAIEIKREIINKYEGFYIEWRNLSLDTGLAIGDGVLRLEIANCSAHGMAVIASIALADWATGVSDIGLNTLKCYTYAVISDAVSNILNSKISLLEKNGKSYEYVYTGDYIVYDDIKEYNLCIIRLCISRILGEKCISEMLKHKSVKLLLNVSYNDDYDIVVNDTITKVESIQSKY